MCEGISRMNPVVEAQKYVCQRRRAIATLSRRTGGLRNRAAICKFEGKNGRSKFLRRGDLYHRYNR